MMEEIYVNVDHVKPNNPIPSTKCRDPRSCKRSSHSGVILSLALLSLSLLVGLIILGVYYRDTLRDSAANLSEMSNKLASMTEDRDLLHANLSEMSNKLANLTENARELERLQNLTRLKKTCPVGWSNFSHSCYLLSESSASWDAARKDCRVRGADLVVIDCGKEQTFLSAITNEHTWIGLNDKEQEGTWKWVDGTPVILTYWAEHQPDDGGGNEDCAHFRNDEKKSWNDLPCSTSLKWICEKEQNEDNSTAVENPLRHELSPRL
ncbi:cytoplasmic tRNA 2-thiolation protein 1 [Sarotherodon galilaeus]